MIRPNPNAISIPLGNVVAAPAKSYAARWDDRLDRSDLNSFDIARLVLAILVVLEHSYFLVDDAAARDPISILSKGQTNGGELAVFMFFSLSGFLVTNSLLNSAGVLDFMTKRVARIVPAFIVAAAISCLVVGPLTASNISRYFYIQNWHLVVADTLALKPYPITGILHGNRLSLIHGTLWTIRYEFDGYLLLACLGILGLMRSRLVVAVYAAIAVALACAMAIGLPKIDHGLAALLISSPEEWPTVFPFFFAGSAFYLFHKFIPKTAALFVASAATIALSFISGGAYWALLFGGTYAILFLSLSFGAHLKLFGRRVDLSYGVYLYGWPVQQILLFYGGMKLLPLQLFLASVPLSCAVAWISWTVVESPILRLIRHRNWQPSPS